MAQNRTPPFRISRYECQKWLGGNMADVYLAFDSQRAQDVVVKLLTEANTHNREAHARFLQEARILHESGHSNLVRKLDSGIWRGTPFLVLEYLQGGTMRDCIHSKAIKELSQVCWVGLQVARGLRHLHNQGVVHRDLKPENIWVDWVNGDWSVKILDLGIARVPNSTLTKLGQVLGTIRYMAPEQAMGKGVTPSSDVYAFGVLLYELLSFRLPYRVSGLSEDEYIAAIVHRPPILDSFVNCEGDSTAMRLKSIIERCLQKRPADRYPSMDAVIADLQPLVPIEAIKPESVYRSAERMFRTVRPQVRWLPVVIVVVAVLLVCLFILHITGALSIIPERHQGMVHVPAGQALVGSDRAQVHVAEYWIDRTEVSNDDFRRFCAATSHPKPPGLDEAGPQLPVVNVTWADAQAYAKWAGKRLPTSLEWEKAVRGGDGRLFPWGDQPDTSRVNLQFTQPAAQAARIAPVTDFPLSSSPYGALNLIGNVWEWVDHRTIPPTDVARKKAALFPQIVPPLSLDEPFYQIRGGGARTVLEPKEMQTLSWDFDLIPARARLASLGFRCVSR